MTKNCTKCASQFEITAEDLEFYDEISPVFNGKKYQVPAPTLCPDCRNMRRLSYKNERSLYRRKCELCGQVKVSAYAPDKALPVFCTQCWWSDKWDAKKYGQDIDFSRSFLQQFKELSSSVPHLGMINTMAENSDYCNATTSMKNSYLTFNAINGEDAYYCKGLSKSKNVVDCLRIYDSELCYECIDTHNCVNCKYLQNCRGCSDCAWCFDCNSCSDCIGCVGLRNKKFNIFNRQYTKDEYSKKKDELFIAKSNQEIQKDFRELKLKVPHLFAIHSNSEDCSGDSIYNSRYAHECYDVVKCENVKFCMELRENNFNSYDISTFGNDIEHSYEATSCGSRMRHCLFVDYCWAGVSDLLYCDYCHTNTSDCFGCFGIRQGKYCILNKQYGKEEYETLVLKIIEKMQGDGEWGEFFPASSSPFGYNETIAMETFPLSREAALAKGFNWSDYTNPQAKVEKVLSAQEVKNLPADIRKVSDDILNWALTCEQSGRIFQVIKPELEFYRRQNLPLPRRHPDQRHFDRLALRNPRHLWNRNCAKCNSPIRTSYAPDRPETVYCETCYLKVIY